jgi:hypothetical protein
MAPPVPLADLNEVVVLDNDETGTAQAQTDADELEQGG